MASEQTTAPKRNGNDEEEWCPEFFFWGSGSNYMVHHYPPETAGGRRPIGFTADIDTFVETWEAPKEIKKVKKSANIQEPEQPTIPKPVQ